MSEHTKAPWNYQNTGVNLHEIYSADGKSIATCWDIDQGLDSEANARHIVHCVNSHGRLVEMVGALLANPGDSFTAHMAESLLATLEAEKGGEL